MVPFLFVGIWGPVTTREVPLFEAERSMLSGAQIHPVGETFEALYQDPVEGVVNRHPQSKGLSFIIRHPPV